jgi:hypothetical protein
MENEPKGPYASGDTLLDDYRLSMTEARIANASYAEGYKAGRASRDGLRAALKQLRGPIVPLHTGACACVACAALAEDEEPKE